MLRLRALGGLEWRCADDAPAPDIARQIRLVVVCLALAGPKGLTRVDLCTLFWPDRPSEQARNSLRQVLVAARKAFLGFPESPLHSDLETVRLRPDLVFVDIQQFRQASASGEHNALIAAARAYQGELLAGVQVSDSIEQFVTPHRRALQEQALAIAECLSQSDDADGAMDAAQALADRLLRSTPTAEEAHRALMRIHHRRGRTNAALQQFNQCRQMLLRELQAEPDAPTRLLYEEIRRSQGNGHETSRSGQANAANSAPDDALPGESLRSGAHPSIAVMPFDNLGDASDEYFADGVVEEITSALSRIRDFFVIARQSAFTFKGHFVDVQKVGRDLGVAYVVEGTVRRGGDRLRISVQLVDAVTRSLLWSERYEGATTEVLEFQDRIAAQVAGALKPAIRQAEIEAARRKPPSSLRAYDLVMRAFPKLWGHNAAAIGEAIPILKDALRIDPNYGRAHALLAWCLALNVTHLWTQDLERETQVIRGALKAALGLIDDDPTALTAAGAALSLCGSHEEASALIERALALDPNNAWAWARRGWIGIYRGHPDMVLVSFERALRLSPLDPFASNTRIGLASGLALSGRPEQAVEIARDVTQKNPDVTWAYRLLAAWAAMAGNLPLAREAARKLLTSQPDFTIRRYLSIPAFQAMPEYRGRLVQGLRDAGLPEG